MGESRKVRNQGPKNKKTRRKDQMQTRGVEVETLKKKLTNGKKALGKREKTGKRKKKKKGGGREEKCPHHARGEKEKASKKSPSEGEEDALQTTHTKGKTKNPQKKNMWRTLAHGKRSTGQD